MLDLEAPRAVQFINTFAGAYAQTHDYKPAHHRDKLVCLPQDGFTDRRKEVLTNFIKSHGLTRKDDPRAFFAEWASYICLFDPLAESGFDIELAPEELETGEPGRRGIDLVLSENSELPIPLLGINVKLQRLPPAQISESHRFDPIICGPSLNVSLGNWEILTREQESKKIREWINELALPKIIDTGKIPYLRSLRQYIVSGIKNTLDIYTWKADQLQKGNYVPNEHQRHLFPRNEEDRQVFMHKLHTVHQLFSELENRNSI